MDILIKNMEMPVDCRFCRFYRKQENGIHYCHAQRTAISGGIEVLDKIRKNCPLVALPSHGDLIDRNKLPIIGITDYKLEGHTVVEFEDVLNAPVILEASE